jgi:signal peptidase I
MITTERRRSWMLVGALAATIYGVGNFFQPTVVVGESMSPTLKNGRVIWIDRTYYRHHKPQCGEVVVFKDDAGTTYVKRVYRGPGETLHYIASGSSFLLPVREPFAQEMKTRYEGGRGMLRIKQMRVDDDSVFVLGDNFNVSIDSRQIGPVPIRSIIGRAHLAANPAHSLRYEFVPKTLGRSRISVARSRPAPAHRSQLPQARLVSNEAVSEVAPLAVDGAAPVFHTKPVRYSQW